MHDTNALTGYSLIGYEAIRGEGNTYQAIAPALSTTLPGIFFNATTGQADQAAQAAAAAFAPYQKLTPANRADFLDAIATEIEAIGDPLIERASAESGLPAGRLTGERGRTTGQLRLFANLLREGSWVGAVINPALPARTPLPRPDLRRMLVPVGPVVVFGASNFPLAFSVAGGDTASALAAGCPVIVKAHPAHPGTSELVGQAIAAAARRTGMPDGVFSLLHAHNAVAQSLVAHPVVKAVGFTGSRAGGLALWRVAQARPEPIPVYAEMSSVNPTVILSGALQERGPAIADGLAVSVTLGVGQFCTNPGLVFVLVPDAEPGRFEAFLEKIAEKIRATMPAPMLTPGIRTAFETGLARLTDTLDTQLLARADQAADVLRTEGQAALLTTTAQAFLAHPTLADEVFGPSSLLVRCETETELAACLTQLDGQLTATLWATEADLSGTKTDWIALLQAKAGRLLFGGYPTGVEVSEAMTHGGPFPATTDARTTSVGTAAIERFVRPVTYQSFPDALLSPALQNANPLGIWRNVDGNLTKAPIL